jgi:hypothetical protein
MLPRSVMRQCLPVLFVVITSGFGCNQVTQNPASPSTTTSPGGPGGTAGPGSSSVGTGLLSVRLTDSPFSEAEAVLVTFSEVSVHRSEAGWETLPFAGGSGERTCDLKQLVGPVDVLGVGPLPAGHYTQIRLTVVSAMIFFDNPAVGGPCASQISAPAGDSAPVKVPSGTVKLNREFTLASGGATTIVLDFDGDRSIKQTGGGNGRGRGNGNAKAADYIMTPVIAVVSVQ